MNDKKKLTRIIIALVTFTVLLVYFVNHWSVLQGICNRGVALVLPFLIGFAIAFVLNIPMRSIESTLFKKPEKKLYKYKRPISMVITYILALLVVAVVILVVVPEIKNTVEVLYHKLPGAVENAKTWVIKYTTAYPEITKKITEIQIDWKEVGALFKNTGGSFLSAAATIFSSIINGAINVVVGVIFSIYILSQKELLTRQMKKFIYAAFKEEVADEMMVFAQIANTTFSKFFASQFREGLILGAMFAISMAILRLPYALTIGILMAFTALIPIFGAFVGMGIGCLLILVESPKLVIWFVILFFVIQFIENYLIYPKLVGGDIGLSALWVLLAVLVGGDLMGVVGMFVFIPLVSVLYSYGRSLINRRLEAKDIDVDKKEVPVGAIPLMQSNHRMFQKKTKKTDEGIIEEILDEITDGPLDVEEESREELDNEAVNEEKNKASNKPSRKNNKGNNRKQ